MPGLRSMIRYWPVPSVTTVRDFSMSTGLAASTLTPGSTAPDASLTRPAIAGWENAGTERSNNARTTDPVARARITASDLLCHVGKRKFCAPDYGTRGQRSRSDCGLLL